MLSKAGGATVRAQARDVRGCTCECVHARACAGGDVQFWGNTDPQNKVSNEFAAPVLARYIVCRTTLGVLCSRVLAQGGTQWVLLLAVPVLARSIRYST